MKKLFLSLAALVACASSVHAQKEDNHFGVKVGGSLTNFVGKDVTSSSSYVFGFHGGLVANIDLTERFSVQPELLYSMKGAKDEATVGSTTIKGTQRLNYVELPILVKAKFNSVFVEAGPQVGALVSAKSKVEGGSLDAEVSNKDQFNTVDFGYAVGAGYQLESGLMVGLRYNGAFSNVAQVVIAGSQSTQAKARNNAFQVYVGYMFGSK